MQLFNGKDLSGWTTWLKESQREDPRKVFSVQDGMLHISGDGYGYLATDKEYRDYHLVTEFKWGDKVWPPRDKAARDSGVLVHATGPDGNANPWMAAVEAQIIEGGVGDFIVVRGKDAEGQEIPVEITAEMGRDRDGEAIWRRGNPTEVITGGRVNWWGRDVDWSDTLGFRGRYDVESPLGEWTRLEVVARGDQLQVWVNGVLVNQASKVKPSAGKILLQTECAELIFRKVELRPLAKRPELGAPSL
jgi:hypothetical protein